MIIMDSKEICQGLTHKIACAASPKQKNCFLNQLTWSKVPLITSILAAVFVIVFPLIIWPRPRKNGRHFADDIFKGIFSNKNVWIPSQISLKFVSQGPINDIPALVQIVAWRRPGRQAIIWTNDG